MKQYLELLKELREKGAAKGDRTGTGTLSKFGHQMRFDLADGFPLVTTKKIHMKSVIHELLWMLNGDTNIKYLTDNGVHIWDAWADENGELGQIYGAQWRRFGMDYSTPGEPKVVDQIADALHLIKTDPDSRRILVTAWNPSNLNVRLPPCHCLVQFYVYNGKLSCQLYQRSADVFLGLPFNIASYALLTHMLAQQACLDVGELIWTGGDTHLYVNHIEQAEIQLQRVEKPLPILVLNKASSIFNYQYEDFQLEGYTPWPTIKAQVSV